MEELSCSFFALQFTLNEIAMLDRLSKMKRLLSAYIAGDLRAWLYLRFFEDSPAVSSSEDTLGPRDHLFPGTGGNEPLSPDTASDVECRW
jgi:hypothetical protein